MSRFRNCASSGIFSLTYECLHLIFKFILSPNSPNSLPISLTCRAFYSLAIPIIYESLELTTDKSIGLLVRTLLSSPHLAKQVKILSIQLQLSPELSPIWILNPAVAATILGSIFRVCLRLEELKLGGVNPNCFEFLESQGYETVMQKLEVLEIDSFNFHVGNYLKLSPKTLCFIFLKLKKLGHLDIKGSFWEEFLGTSIEDLFGENGIKKKGNFGLVKELRTLKLGERVHLTPKDWSILGDISILKELDLELNADDFVFSSSISGGSPDSSSSSESSPSYLKPNSTARGVIDLLEKSGSTLITLRLRAKGWLSYRNRSLSSIYPLDSPVLFFNRLENLSLDYHMLSDLGFSRLPTTLVEFEGCINGVGVDSVLDVMRRINCLRVLRVWGTDWTDSERDEVAEEGQRLGIDVTIGMRVDDFSKFKS